MQFCKHLTVICTYVLVVVLGISIFASGRPTFTILQQSVVDRTGSTEGRHVIECIEAERDGQSQDGDCRSSLSSLEQLFNVTDLHLDLSHCRGTCRLNARSFHNCCRGLQSLTLTGPPTSSVTISASLFAGLRRLDQLTVEGFESLVSGVPEGLLKPLTGLRRLELRNATGDNPSVERLSRLLGELRQLDDLRLIDAWPAGNGQLNFSALFANCRHLTVRRLTAHGVSTLAGRLSVAMPSLEYLDLQMDQDMFPTSVWTTIDFILLHPSLVGVDVTFSHDVLPRMSSLLTQCPLPFGLCGDSKRRDSTEDIIRDVISASKPAADADCYGGIVLQISPKMRVNNVINFHTAWLAADANTYCVSPDNEFESVTYKGIANRDPMLNWTARGLDKLQQLSVYSAGLRYVNPHFLESFPRLTELVFVDNGPGPFDAFAAANASELLRNNSRLKTIDISGNSIARLPSTLFRDLRELESISVDRSRIAEVDLEFSTSRQLRQLSFRDGTVGRFSPRMMTQLDAVFGAALTVDLRNNSLLCDCGALDFVAWIQQTSVRFVDVTDYTCTLPSGKLKRLTSVDVRRWTEVCAAADEMKNGSDCPCATLSDVVGVRRSLVGRYCRSSSGALVALDSLDSSDACAGAPRHRLWASWMTAAASLTILVGVLVALAAAVRRRRLVCVQSDLRSLVKMLTRVVLEYVRGGDVGGGDSDAESPPPALYDVFLFYHERDAVWAHGTLADGIRRRLGKLTVTRDDFVPGSFWLDPVVECVARSRHTVLVLSPDFIACEKCQLVAAKVYSEQLHRLIVIARCDIDEEVSTERSPLFSVFRLIDDCCRIVHWPQPDSAAADSSSAGDGASVKRFWAQLRRLLDDKDAARARTLADLISKRTKRRRNSLSNSLSVPNFHATYNTT